MDHFPITPPIVVKDTPTPRRLATVGEACDYVDEAMRLGLDASDSTSAVTMTANGAVSVRRLTLARVTVGDVTVYNVEAVVGPQSMPFVLLGNSFLSHFQLHSDSSTLVLEKKN